MPSFVVEVDSITYNVTLDTAPGAPAAVEVLVPGLQGPQGPQGTTFTVSATPPLSPEIGDLWLDIS